MTQERVSKQTGTQKQEDAPEVQEAKDVRNEELAEKTDDVLDSIEDVLDKQDDLDLLSDIDDLLEENAEEFVAAYVQQGGE